MIILIADRLAQTTVDELRELGADVRVEPGFSADDLPSHVSDVNVLVVRSTKVTAETIAAGPMLSLIIRAGAGVNTIDVAEASRRGVYVTNCPGKNSAAVAELAIGLLIACDRRIVNACVDLRNGAWRKGEYGKANGLRGRTLGILGMGQIGREVAQRAAALGMQVLAWSRSLDEAAAEAIGVERAASPLEVAMRCDAVSIHLAATKQTQHFVDREFLAALRPGAILVNTSRGNLVDTKALREAIATNNLRVGLDVFEAEPKGGEATFEDLALAAEITATPHIGASTAEASEAIAEEVVRIVASFRRTGRPPNTVNMCARSPATHALVVRHYNQVGVLASVLDLLREEGINVEEMENTVFEKAKAACCTLRLDSPPNASAVDRLRALDAVLQVTMEAL